MDYCKINKVVISREAAIPDVISSLEQTWALPLHMQLFLIEPEVHLQRPLLGLLLSAGVWSAKTLIFLTFSKIIALVYYIDDICLLDIANWK